MPARRSTWPALGGALAMVAMTAPGPIRAQQTPRSVAVPSRTAATDSARRAVERDLERGLAWTAARSAAAWLSTHPADADPAMVLAAARAHAAAAAWPAVRRLLFRRPWLDSLDGGEGRRLLARAAAELGEPEEAVRHYGELLDRRAATAPRSTRAQRARALLAAGRPAEAATDFAAAAGHLPELAAWLRLSALQAHALAGEAEAALKLEERLRGVRAVPRDSVAAAAVEALFRAGRTPEALRRLPTLPPGVRAGLAAPWAAPALLARGDTVAAREALDEALAVAAPDRAAVEARLALGADAETLRRAGEADLRAGRHGAAAEVLVRALAGAAPAARPEIALGLAEARIGRGRATAAREGLEPWLASGGEAWGGPPDERILGAMWFQAGRAEIRRGRPAAAAEAWRRAAEFAAAEEAPYSAFLAADVWHDRGDIARARPLYERAAQRYPTSAWGGAALMRLGFLDLLEQRPADALQRFDAYGRRFRAGNWSDASLYWGGRAAAALGDSAEAARRWERVLRADPISFYGLRAAESLGVDPLAALRRAEPDGDTRLRPEDLALVTRMGRLRELGWEGRALRELAARRRAGETPWSRLALAEALHADGWSWQGVSVAWSVLRSRGGVWSDRLLRAVYPLPWPAAVRAVADRTGLEPALVAAVARRESRFDPDVVSAANAVGLMQLLPSTARELAGRAGLGEFDPRQLVVPEVNLTLGARYLDELLERYDGSLTAALIAYNAGPHRLTRWRELPEFRADAELMIERIPFRETRLYVKAVYLNRWLYGRLWEPAPSPDGEARASGPPAVAGSGAGAGSGGS